MGRAQLILIILAATLLAAVPASSKSASPEFRALWVHNWRSGLLNSSEVDETVRWAKSCNMNALVVQVRRVGDAYYDSAFEPHATNIQCSNFDPLGYTIKQAKANGLEVHAWFNVFRVCTTTISSDPKHVANTHPEWLSKDVNGISASSDGKFLDPGVPEVRTYLVKLISDLVGKYDIDGVTLDYIRYPENTWGYNDIAVARFNAKYGRTGKPSPTDPLWCDWRREQVTETVRAIRDEIHRLKPRVKLSAATVAWGDCPSDFTKTSAYGHVFQDWRKWMEDGLLDANMLMNYREPSGQNASFVGWLVGAKKWSGGRHVYCGLMAYDDRAAGTVSQVKLAREKGVQGVVGFAFSQSDQPLKSDLACKLKTVFEESAPVPAMPWKGRACK